MKVKGNNERERRKEKTMANRKERRRNMRKETKFEV